MRYVSLHHHSTYSWLDGYGQPKDHVERAAEVGMTALALTEHGNISSHPKLEQAAKEAGIKPLFGVEAYFNPLGTMSQRKNHLTILAETNAGYKNLMRAVSDAWRPRNEDNTYVDDAGGSYYQPTMTEATIAKYRDGLFVLSGCRGSLLSTSLVGGKNIEGKEASFGRGLAVADEWHQMLGASYFLEVQAFPELPDTCRINVMLEKIGRLFGIPLVATTDVHYCRPEDSDIQVILHATRPGSVATFEEQEQSWGYDIKLSHATSDREVYDRLLGTGLSKRAARDAIENTAAIAERCNVELPKAGALSYPLPPGYVTTQELWKDALRAGWQYRRIGEKANVSTYAARLRHEVKTIEGKDFIDYFLIVSDMVRHAKNNGVFVGPARGSAAASLVCYLLRITEVDPLLFDDLVFERFIDVTRQDLPDIDLDFDDKRRSEVMEYLQGKYGREHVGQLGTYTTYKSKNSLDDAARVFNVPKWDIDTVKGFLIERSSGDLRAQATIEDTVSMFPEAAEVFERYPDLRHAMRLEGMVKGMGKHAAGAIVSSEPLTDTCAVYGDVIAVDKYDAEYLGLLKMDNLGLKTCGMLAEACEMMGTDPTFFYELPLDDAETIRGFAENDVKGIFQYDGRAMGLVNSSLIPDRFYEVAVVTALARPGPLHNDATDNYIDIKHGRKQPEFKHPLYDPIVAHTQYQVIYQEQILRILREIGRFDWTSLMRVRKIISRKIGEQAFNKEWSRFLRGATKQGMDEETAKKIWGMCITAGAYAFNAAHSVSYGTLAYWCMWLKRHEPTIFYVAALRRLPEEKHLDLLRDAVRHGFKVLPPHPARSLASWTAGSGRTLRAGFEQIPGIGEKTATSIVEWLALEAPDALNGRKPRWEDLIAVKGIGKVTIEKMLAFVHSEDPLGVHLLDRKITEVKAAIRAGDIRSKNGDYMPMPTHRTIDVPMARGEDIPVVWIGTIFNRNLRDLFEINMKRTGIPLDPDKVRDPQLREWLIMHGTDGEGILTVIIDRWRYPRFKELAWGMKPNSDLVLVRGVKKGFLPTKAVYASDIWVIE